MLIASVSGHCLPVTFCLILSEERQCLCLLQIKAIICLLLNKIVSGLFSPKQLFIDRSLLNRKLQKMGIIVL